MDIKVAGHLARRPFMSIPLVALDDRRFRIRLVDVKGGMLHRQTVFALQKIFLLKLCSAFLIFFANRKGGSLEAANGNG